MVLGNCAGKTNSLLMEIWKLQNLLLPVLDQLELFTNVLMLGIPGAGKAMLAQSATTIFPEKTIEDAIDTTRIDRVAGFTGDRTALVTTRPCRGHHHTTCDVELISGGHLPLPGEVSKRAPPTCSG
jgi:hypothetical protein